MYAILNSHVTKGIIHNTDFLLVCPFVLLYVRFPKTPCWIVKMKKKNLHETGINRRALNSREKNITTPKILFEFCATNRYIHQLILYVCIPLFRCLLHQHTITWTERFPILHGSVELSLVSYANTHIVSCTSSALYEHAFHKSETNVWL